MADHLRLDDSRPRGQEDACVCGDASCTAWYDDGWMPEDDELVYADSQSGDEREAALSRWIDNLKEAGGRVVTRAEREELDRLRAQYVQVRDAYLRLVIRTKRRARARRHLVVIEGDRA